MLWRQAERVSARAKAYALGGRTVVLKLKTANFRLLTRSASLEAPTQLADSIFRTAQVALKTRSRRHGASACWAWACPISLPPPKPIRPA